MRWRSVVMDTSLDAQHSTQSPLPHTPAALDVKFQ
jgi:hypothetical protein